MDTHLYVNFNNQISLKFILIHNIVLNIRLGGSENIKVCYRIMGILVHLLDCSWTGCPLTQTQTVRLSRITQINQAQSRLLSTKYPSTLYYSIQNLCNFPLEIHSIRKLKHKLMRHPCIHHIDHLGIRAS